MFQPCPYIGGGTGGSPKLSQFIPCQLKGSDVRHNELARLGEDQKLLPGMPAEAYIQTGDRSPLDYFLKPLMVQILRAFKEN